MRSWLNKCLLALAVGLSLHAQGAETSDGEVRKVDKAQGKVTIKHGEIKNLDMPPMTMVFMVKDKAALDTLKVGDRVKFVAGKEGGTYTVTEIQVVP
jgi:Cu(I)/Ag(I) efflux system protein CusF